MARDSGKSPLTYEACNFVSRVIINFGFHYLEAMIRFDLLGYWPSSAVDATHLGTVMQDFYI